MKLLRFIACLLLLLPCIALAEDDPESVIERMEDVMEKFQQTGMLGKTKIYYVMHSTINIGVTVKYMDGCMTLLSGPLFLNIYKDNNILAWVMAHEAGHCVLGHLEYLDQSNQPLSWTMEYEADQFGNKLATAAGYDVKKGMKEFFDSEWVLDHGLGVPDITHPGGDQRIVALVTGKRSYWFMSDDMKICLWSLGSLITLIIGLVIIERKKYTRKF